MPFVRYTPFVLSPLLCVIFTERKKFKKKIVHALNFRASVCLLFIICCSFFNALARSTLTLCVVACRIIVILFFMSSKTFLSLSPFEWLLRCVLFKTTTAQTADAWGKEKNKRERKEKYQILLTMHSLAQRDGEGERERETT